MDHDDVSRSPRESCPPSQSNGRSAEAARRRILEPQYPPAGPSIRATDDEELLNRDVPSLPRAKAPELASFTHSEPWRVLRIQGEFVHGINALAEVGAGVAVFGSARFGPDRPHYGTAREM